MEGIVVTDPVPAVEEPEITSDATTGPERAEPTASAGSGGGDESTVSRPRSLTHYQQVQNLKENWKRTLPWTGVHSDFEKNFETNPWFARVVAKLRVDPCLDSCELEIDQSLLLGFLVSGFRMTSLDLAILMGDLKMVQTILKSSSVPDIVIQGSLVDPRRASGYTSLAKISKALKKTGFLYTPLHLAVAGRDSDIVDALLEKGADVNAQNWFHDTPLDLACKLGNLTMLRQLLAKDREESKDPLHLAMRHGHIGIIEELEQYFGGINVNAVDNKGKTPLHYLAPNVSHSFGVTGVLDFLPKCHILDLKALDSCGLSAFYVAVLCCNTELVIALLDSFKDRIRLNEACDNERGPPIQIAFEGGDEFKDIESALMECDPVKGYMERLYRDRQVYVDAANAILVGAALIASVTFASWLQPPLSYTSYFGEGYSSFVPTPSTSNVNYVDVEHNIALRAFWVFNALSFYFAIATVVCGARSVLPRSHLFIKKTVEKLRTNLLVTAVLLACSVLFVIIAFAIAGTIVLTPLIKYQWCMIVPSIVGGMVCIISLGFLVKSMAQNYFNIRNNSERFKQKEIDDLEDRGYILRQVLDFSAKLPLSFGCEKDILS